jgi:hypothetical protein
MTDGYSITTIAGREYKIGAAAPTPPTVCIRANDNRPLLTIKPDGTVEGEIEDASEAARLFVEHIRRMTDPASEWQSRYDAGIEAAANALEADARLCDCAALEDGECACGAWHEWKSISSARAIEIVRGLVKETPLS